MSSSPEEKTVFARQATGLVRGYSLSDAILINLIGLFSLPFLAIALLLVPLLFPGGNIVIALLIALPILLAFSYVEGVLASAMPKSGGDYVFGSRIVHPVAGLISSWMIFGGQIVTIASLPATAFATFLPALLQYPFGAGTTGFGAFLTSHNGTVIVGAIAMVLLTLPVLFGQKPYKYTVRVLVGLGFVSLFLILIVLATSSVTGLSNSFTNFATAYNSTYTYQNIVSAGAITSSFSWTNTILVALFSLFFIIANWPVQFGGEIKQAQRSLPIAMVVSSVFSWLLCFVGVLLFFRIVSPSFAAGLVTSTPALPFTGSLNLLIRVLSGNPLIEFIVGVGIVAWFLAIIPSLEMINSRILFAWSFDRLLPKSVSDVNERFATPIKATLVIMVLSIIFLFIETYSNIIATVIANESVQLVISYIPTGLAALIFAYKRKEIFAVAPEIAKKKVGGIPVLSIAGGFLFVSLIAMIVVIVENPGAVSAPVNATTLAILLGFALISVFMYYFAVWYRKAHNHLDISLAFKEIPPE